MAIALLHQVSDVPWQFSATTWKGRAPRLLSLETSHLHMGRDGERENVAGGVLVCVSAWLVVCLFVVCGPAITQFLASFSWACTWNADHGPVLVRILSLETLRFALGVFYQVLFGTQGE